jgi:hypothetical protein
VLPTHKLPALRRRISRHLTQASSRHARPWAHYASNPTPQQCQAPPDAPCSSRACRKQHGGCGGSVPGDSTKAGKQRVQHRRKHCGGMGNRSPRTAPSHLASQRNSCRISGCCSATRRLPPGMNSIATSSSWPCRQPGRCVPHTTGLALYLGTPGSGNAALADRRIGVCKTLRGKPIAVGWLQPSANQTAAAAAAAAA